METDAPLSPWPVSLQWLAARSTSRGTLSWINPWKTPPSGVQRVEDPPKISPETRNAGSVSFFTELRTKAGPGTEEACTESTQAPISLHNESPRRSATVGQWTSEPASVRCALYRCFAQADVGPALIALHLVSEHV